MKKYILFICLLFLFTIKSFCQTGNIFNHYFTDKDSIKYPFQAAVLSLTPDIVIFNIDRFILKSDFSYINGQTITSNFMFTWLWDNDDFGTNLITHPLHGSLDYCGARTSGMNFWLSIPYTFNASLVWEMVCENEPMSFNDQLATSIAGPAIGEISYRLSNSILDESRRGFNRVVREIFGTLTCPMNGIKRIITGEMWKTIPKVNYPDNYYFPINFSVYLSNRNFKSYGKYGKIHNTPFLTARYNYGDPFCNYQNKPYDYFFLEGGFDLSFNKNFLSSVTLCGKLWGKQLSTKTKDTNLMWGIFQHFQYQNKIGTISDSIPSMRYSEPASFGPGIMYKRNLGNFEINAAGYINLSLLTAAEATNFDLKYRTYNYGQGYSNIVDFDIKYKNLIKLGARNYFLQFFTWKGYNPELDIEKQNYLVLRAMGDKGSTVLNHFKPYLEINLLNGISAKVILTYFNQRTHNENYKDKRYHYREIYAGLKYCF